MSVEEFLAAEPKYPEKHEYLGGAIYAMVGASTAHNVIAMNLYGILHAGLRGRRCQAFGSDMKVRLKGELEDTLFQLEELAEPMGVMLNEEMDRAIYAI